MIKAVLGDHDYSRTKFVVDLCNSLCDDLALGVLTYSEQQTTDIDMQLTSPKRVFVTSRMSSLCGIKLQGLVITDLQKYPQKDMYIHTALQLCQNLIYTDTPGNLDFATELGAGILTLSSFVVRHTTAPVRP